MAQTARLDVDIIKAPPGPSPPKSGGATQRLSARTSRQFVREFVLEMAAASCIEGEGGACSFIRSGRAPIYPLDVRLEAKEFTSKQCISFEITRVWFSFVSNKFLEGNTPLRNVCPGFCARGPIAELGFFARLMRFFSEYTESEVSSRCTTCSLANSSINHFTFEARWIEKALYSARVD